MHMMEGLCECSHVAENGDGGKLDGWKLIWGPGPVFGEPWDPRL